MPIKIDKEYHRQQRRKKGVKERLFGLNHGTRAGYNKYKCRCELCRDAQQKYYRRWADRKGVKQQVVMGWGKKGQLRFISEKIKTEANCMDCKVNYPYYVLQFDHRPESGKKKFTIAEAIRESSVTPEELFIEINKCDIVCANCHMIRTYERKKKI